MKKMILFLLSLVTLTSCQIATFPYVEDFESESAATTAGWSASLGTGSSTGAGGWQLLTAANNKRFAWQRSAAQGAGAFFTGNAAYVRNLRAFLTTPEFDLSTMAVDKAALLSFKLAFDTQVNTDGMVLQYRNAANGNNWMTLGSMNEQKSTQWFNSNDVAALTSNWLGSTSKMGWSGSSESWLSVGIEVTDKTIEQFRFAFGSTGTPNGIAHGGIAIDVFSIEEMPDPKCPQIQFPTQGATDLKATPFDVRWQRDSTDHAVLPFGYTISLQSVANSSFSYIVDVAKNTFWTTPFKPSGTYTWQAVPYGASQVCAEASFTVSSQSPQIVPYQPTFVVDDMMGWSSSDSYASSDDVASSWRLGVAQGSSLTGNDVVWQAGGSSGYNAGELSFVESPLIDLSAVTLPQVRLSLRVNTRAGLDGAQLQMSINGGVSWMTVDSDLSVYDISDIEGFADIVSGGVTNAAWSGSRATPRSVVVNVTQASCSSANVVFRVLFGAAETALNSPLDGFAFKDFEVVDLLPGGSCELPTPSPTPLPTPMPTPTAPPIAPTNCAGCNLVHIRGSASWCRCCFTAPYCAPRGQSIYNLDTCVLEESFCGNVCREDRFCANTAVMLPVTAAPTPFPTPAPTPAPTPTPEPTPAPTPAPTPLQQNCDRCQLGSLIMGGEDWCRCCASAPYCSARGMSVFSRQGCLSAGFCVSQCTSEPQYCAQVEITPAPTPAPTPVPTTTTVQATNTNQLSCRVSQWAPWSACDKQCASEGGSVPNGQVPVGQQTRERATIGPAPPNGCPPLLETRPCNVNAPVCAEMCYKAGEACLLDDLYTCCAGLECVDIDPSEQFEELQCVAPTTMPASTTTQTAPPSTSSVGTTTMATTVACSERKCSGHGVCDSQENCVCAVGFDGESCEPATRTCAMRDSDNDGVTDCEDTTFELSALRQSLGASGVVRLFAYNEAGTATAGAVDCSLAALPASVESLIVSSVASSELPPTGQSLRSNVVRIEDGGGAPKVELLEGRNALVCVAGAPALGGGSGSTSSLCLGTLVDGVGWRCAAQPPAAPTLGQASATQGLLCGQTPHFSLFALIEVAEQAPLPTDAPTPEPPTVATPMPTPQQTNQPMEPTPAGNPTDTSELGITVDPPASGLEWYWILLIILGVFLCLALLIGLIFYVMNKDTGAVPDESFRAEQGDVGMATLEDDFEFGDLPTVDSGGLDTAERACAKCDTWLTGRVIEADGRYWHPRCFKCDSCGEKLDVDVERVGSQALCPPCAASSQPKQSNKQKKARKTSDIFVDIDNEPDSSSASSSSLGSLEEFVGTAKRKNRRPSEYEESTVRRKERARARARAEKERGKMLRAKARAKAARAKARAEAESRARRGSDVARRKSSSDQRFSGVFAPQDSGDEYSYTNSSDDRVKLGPRDDDDDLPMPSQPSPALLGK